MSWKPEILAQSGNWLENALRFSTRQEAELYLANLSSDETSIRAIRVSESDDTVNYAWRKHRLAVR